MWLVANGIPPEMAFEMDELYVNWMAIKFSEFRGAKFDLKTMQFADDASCSY